MRATPQSPKSQTSVESNGTSQVIIDCKIDHLYYLRFVRMKIGFGESRNEFVIAC